MTGVCASTSGNVWMSVWEFVGVYLGVSGCLTMSICLSKGACLSMLDMAVLITHFLGPSCRLCTQFASNIGSC